MKHRFLLRCAFLALCLLLLLTGCGAVKEFVNEQALGDDAGKIAKEDDSFVRTPPPVAMPEFSDAPVYYNDDGVNNCAVDVTNLSKGYIGVRYDAPGVERARFRLQTGDYLYNYIMKTDGTEQFFPLAMGSGQYDFSVWYTQQVEGDSYTQFLNGSEWAELESEQTPFLYPNGIVDYTPDSYAVTQGYEIGRHAQSDLEFVQDIYAWVRDNVTYDKQKAATVRSGYLPSIDGTMRDKTGICYDYAAMVAAIFRSNGIPCKLIEGQADTGNGQMIAHAWNMIWLEEEGWITVEIPTTPEEWQRIDLTFAAALGKGPNQYVGDGTDYVDIYVH